MNNRLKFRGIHPVLGELQEIKFIDFIHNTVDFGDGDIFKIEEVNIQQCTGLKDKNGKLIYEGDIVNSRHITPMGTKVNMVCIVEFDRGAFWINFKRGATYLVNDDTCHEVIGNIYENKDLLNEN